MADMADYFVDLVVAIFVVGILFPLLTSGLALINVTGAAATALAAIPTVIVLVLIIWALRSGVKKIKG